MDTDIPFNLLRATVVLSVLIFIVGMINPRWILFWVKKPDRLVVTMIAMLLFMGGWTGIAKLRMKPKEPKPDEVQRAIERQNELPLDNR